MKGWKGKTLLELLFSVWMRNEIEGLRVQEKLCLSTTCLRFVIFVIVLKISVFASGKGGFTPLFWPK